jgi:Protein of unknown function (DUF4232)
MSRRRIGLLGAAVLGVALAACGSSSSSSKPAASTTTRTGTGGETTSSSGETTSTISKPPSCAFSQLAVTSTGNSGMGHIGVVLLFKNTGTRTCTLAGYPGVAGLNSAGQQVVQAQRTLNGYMRALPPGESPPVVTLAAGESASAFVEGTDVPRGNAACVTYPALLVTPPNTTQSLTIDASMPGCSPVQVHPVVPGTTGSIVV